MQLGRGIDYSAINGGFGPQYVNTPVTATALAQYQPAYIVLGGSAGCIIGSDGYTRCWGDNAYRVVSCSAAGRAYRLLRLFRA